MKTLSDKIIKSNSRQIDSLFIDDIKDFIKKLKEELKDRLGADEYIGEDLASQRWIFEIEPMIDKLAGDKLI